MILHRPSTFSGFNVVGVSDSGMWTVAEREARVSRTLTEALALPVKATNCNRFLRLSGVVE